jgi:hypothetical protein
MDRIGKKDKAVVRAFTEGRALEGHKLRTDGKRLDIIALGGNGVAVWKGDKIHLPDTGSRSGQYVQGVVKREAPKNDLVNGRGYNPKKRKQYRAIRWYHDDMKPVGEWRNTRAHALSDYYVDFDPNSRVAIWEIETSTGERLDITEDEYQRARSGHAASLRARDERGVWGNPKRVKNSHNEDRSAREFAAWVQETNNEAIAAAEKGEAGDIVGMLDHVISSAYALGRASAERRYAGSQADAVSEKDFRSLVNGRNKWADSVVAYMRENMGVAANPAKPKRRNPSTKAAACTVGASAHKSRSAAARQCGAKWKASKEKFASTGGKAAARSPKSPIGKRGKRRRARRS